MWVVGDNAELALSQPRWVAWSERQDFLELFKELIPLLLGGSFPEVRSRDQVPPFVRLPHGQFGGSEPDRMEPSSPFPGEVFHTGVTHGPLRHS